MPRLTYRWGNLSPWEKSNLQSLETRKSSLQTRQKRFLLLGSDVNIFSMQISLDMGFLRDQKKRSISMTATPKSESLMSRSHSFDSSASSTILLSKFRTKKMLKWRHLLLNRSKNLIRNQKLLPKHRNSTRAMSTASNLKLVIRITPKPTNVLFVSMLLPITNVRLVDLCYD